MAHGREILFFRLPRTMLPGRNTGKYTGEEDFNVSESGTFDEHTYIGRFQRSQAEP